jgi:hypothetical protein
MIRQLARCCVVFALSTIALLTSTSSLLAQDDDNWPAIVRTKPLVAEDGDDEVLRLRKTIFNSAVKEMEISFQSYRIGIGQPQSHIETLQRASKRLVDAALEIYPDEAKQREFLEGHLEMAKICEITAEARWQGGADTELKYHRARFDRLTAEIRLMKAHRTWEKAKKVSANK